MHKNVTHNRCHTTYNDFCEAVLGFLRHDKRGRWNTFCDSVTDNFRIISPEGLSGCQVSRVYIKVAGPGQYRTRSPPLPLTV